MQRASTGPGVARQQRVARALLIASLASVGTLALAQDSSAPADLATLDDRLVEVSVDGGEKLAALRIDRVTVAIAGSASGDEPLTLTAGSGRGRRTISGSVVSDSDETIAIATFPADQLDAAGVAIVPLAQSSGAFGDYVSVVTPNSAVGSALLESPKRLWLFDREAMAVSGARPDAGGAVLNGCDELVGLISADSDGEFADAQTLAVVQRLLDDAGIDIAAADDACETDKDGLALLTEKLSADAQRARSEAERIDAEAAQLRQQLQAGRYSGRSRQTAEARLAALEADAVEARASAERADEAEERIEDHESSHRFGIIAAIGLALAAIGMIVGAVFMSRRNKKFIRDREQSIAVIAQQTNTVEARLQARPWRDVLMRGDSGILKISAQQLSEGGDGVVIGRSETSADVIFSPADVSRRHARLYVEDDLLWIVDLESASGTFVKGRQVRPQGPVTLASGDLVRIASHEFKVTFP